MKKLISILDLSIDEIDKIFSIADIEKKLYQQYNNALEGKMLGNFFFQPSTRTQFSLQAAFMKLGGKVISCSDINQTRSGPPYFEPLDDMGHIVSSYCDIVAMRTINDMDTKLFVREMTVPFISAGSGNIEHPTQALVDLFSIKKYYKQINNNNILIIGTPRQRTINSFILGLSRYKNINVHILSQSGVYLMDEVFSKCSSINIAYYSSWEELISANILSSISIVYVDKIFNETKEYNYFIIQKDYLELMNKDVLILHPLPRTKELPKHIDVMPGAYYYRQAELGMYVRSALFLYFMNII
jgi:aspartate carbamoyltransferase catalytic subunit